MSKMSELGVQAELATLTETVEINGLTSTKDFKVTTMTLPKTPRVQASFTHEGFGAKVTKLFKKELQTGDDEFDGIVYIRTDTPAETAALLASKDIRSTIMLAVMEGGSIVVEGAKLVTKIPDGGSEEDHAATRLVEALLT